MMTISVETLRAWLEEGHPVTLLDVRPPTEYVEWSIPGSLHVDAYEALKAHDPETALSQQKPSCFLDTAVSRFPLTASRSARRLPRLMSRSG